MALTTDPPAMRTRPAVSVVAWMANADSFDTMALGPPSIRLTAARNPAPAYTWHDCVSHVLAYVYRFCERPYERAATAWARKAFIPAPPASPPHDAGISRGTTPCT